MPFAHGTMPARNAANAYAVGIGEEMQWIQQSQPIHPLQPPHPHAFAAGPRASKKCARCPAPGGGAAVGRRGMVRAPRCSATKRVRVAGAQHTRCMRACALCCSANGVAHTRYTYWNDAWWTRLVANAFRPAAAVNAWRREVAARIRRAVRSSAFTVSRAACLPWNAGTTSSALPGTTPCFSTRNVVVKARRQRGRRTPYSQEVGGGGRW